jgi:uncharacterized protein YutE (UPF0331/DUF86 family)
VSLDDETEDRILENVAYIQEAVDILAEKQTLDEAAYLQDRQQRDIVEREFQTAIEACIDIATLLCKSIDTDIPEHNAAKFTLLQREAVVTDETAVEMQEAVGFRNVLAHRYGDKIDDSLVYRSLQSDLHWFMRFLRDVRAFLESD